jgi:hypothetical protein
MAITDGHHHLLQFFNYDDLYDVVIVIDEKTQIKSHKIILSKCVYFRAQFGLSKHWKDNNASIINVHTTDIIKEKDYVLFFKLVYSESFDDFEDDIRASLIQIDILAGQYIYKKLLEYTASIFTSFISMDNIIGVSAHLFQDVPEETVQARNKLIHFTKAVIGLIKQKKDVIRNLLSVMPFGILSDVLLSEECMVPCIFRKQLFNEYLFVHYGINDFSLIRTCSRIDIKTRNCLDFLYKTIQSKFFLDSDKYTSDYRSEITLRKGHNLSRESYSNGGLLLRHIKTLSEDGKDIILEKNMFIGHSMDGEESSNEYDIFIFDFDMNLIKSVMTIKTALVKKRFSIEYSLSSTVDKIEIRGSVDMFVFTKNGTEKVSIKDFYMGSDAPRERLLNGTILTTENTFTSDEISGIENSYLIPIKMVYYITSIKIHQHSHLQ